MLCETESELWSNLQNSSNHSGATHDITSIECVLGEQIEEKKRTNMHYRIASGGIRKDESYVLTDQSQQRQKQKEEKIGASYSLLISTRMKGRTKDGTGKLTTTGITLQCVRITKNQDL